VHICWARGLLLAVVVVVVLRTKGYKVCDVAHTEESDADLPLAELPVCSRCCAVHSTRVDCSGIHSMQFAMYSSHCVSTSQVGVVHQLVAMHVCCDLAS
jgi:hypothetical protein